MRRIFKRIFLSSRNHIRAATLSQLPFAEAKAVALAEDLLFPVNVTVEFKVLHGMRSPVEVDPLQLLQNEKNRGCDVRPPVGGFDITLATIQSMKTQHSELS